MFTLRYDITHGNSEIFLVVCLRNIIKEKKCSSKIDQNLGHVSDPLSLLKFTLEPITNLKLKPPPAEVHSLTVVLNGR